MCAREASSWGDGYFVWKRSQLQLSAYVTTIGSFPVAITAAKETAGPRWVSCSTGSGHQLVAWVTMSLAGEDDPPKCQAPGWVPNPTRTASQAQTDHHTDVRCFPLSSCCLEAGTRLLLSLQYCKG